MVRSVQYTTAQYDPNYIPERGDIVQISFDPQQKSFETQKRRPALVLSTKDFNSLLNVSVVCPITSRGRGINFEVEIPSGLGVRGFIRPDQVICFDWCQRQAVFRETMGADTVQEVSDIIVEDIVWGSEDEPHYIPRQGEVVEIKDDSNDYQQALVLSPSSFNYWQRLVLICRIIMPDNGITFPRGFAVDIPTGSDVNGVVLADQVKSWNWWDREAKHLGYLPNETVDEVSGKVEAIMYGD